MPGNYWDGRRDRNAKSRNAANHDREPWSQAELELLDTWDHSEDELEVMAEVLGRTIEACRQRYYLLQHGIGARDTLHTTTTTTTTTTHTVQTRWSPEDEDEYPSDWYVR